MLQLISNPATWIGFGAGMAAMLVLGLCFIALVGRANDDVDPHARHLGTGATWPGSEPTNSWGPGPHSTRRSDLRSGPR